MEKDQSIKKSMIKNEDIMKEIAIENQEDLDKFLEIIDWHDSFIREIYCVSPSYIVEDPDLGTVAADALPGVKLLICTPYPETPGVEFFFEEVDAINVPFSFDLEPVGKIDSWGVKLYLDGKGGHYSISAQKLTCKILDKSCWGWDVNYGLESYFDESGFKL